MVDSDDGVPQRVLLPEVRFSKLPLGNQLLHGVASPSIAYLLFLAAMVLVLVDFFTGGIGIAAGTGIMCGC